MKKIALTTAKSRKMKLVAIIAILSIIAIITITAVVLINSAHETELAQIDRPAYWAQPVQMEGVPNLYKVSDTLYRSAQPSAEGMVNLKAMGIKTVVNLRSLHSDSDEIGNTGLAYEEISMNAWHPEDEDAVRFLQIVTDPANAPILVHCQSGADRTGSMCAVYRIAVQGWSKEEATNEMLHGGFGFHIIWDDLADWINNLDIDRIKTQAGIEDWVDQLIAKFQSEPVGKPPQSIYKYDYEGQIVYYVPPQCCDQDSQLYDANGSIICAPDGGLTGSGDKKCPDFFNESTNRTLIWRDSRTR